MIYTAEVKHMCPVAKGAYHGPAPIPEEGKWVQAKEIKDISGFTHGVGWCAPQQGACKLSLNVKDGIIEEALVETVEVDLSGLKAGDVVKVKDLAIAADKDVVLVTDPEAVVVTVTVPHNAPIPETDAEEAEEAEK